MHVSIYPRSMEQSSVWRQKAEGGARGWGRRGELVFNRYRAQSEKKNEVLGMDGSDGCTAL